MDLVLPLLSAGTKISDEDLLEKAGISLEAGVVGFLFGRNLWQRKFEYGLRIGNELKSLMFKY